MCGATGIGRAASAGPSYTRLLHTPLTRLSHASHTPLTRRLHASAASACHSHTPLTRFVLATYTALTRLLHASYTPLARCGATGIGHAASVCHAA
jgi:hypothetical protein